MNLRHLNLGILTLLFALLPFHTFLVNVAIGLFPDGQIFAAWKEILLILFGLGFLGLLAQKKIPLPKLDALDVIIIAYVIWALLTGFARWGGDLERILWGAKYSLSFPVFFLLLRHFPFQEKEKSKLFWILLITGAAVVFFGVLQKFLPPDFLVHFGYAAEFSQFDPYGATSYCQKVSFTDTCRLQSFLSGPNQFSAYLLFVLPLFFFLIFHPFKKIREKMKEAPRRAFGATFFLLGLIGLFFAYSRAAWAGFLISFAVGFILLFYKQKWFKPFFWSALGIGIIALFSFLLAVPKPYAETCAPYDTFEQMEERADDGVVTRFFCEMIYRASSSQGHWERTRDGLEHIVMHPFGTGLGDSGPASARFYDNKIGFIPESWYLQVGIDTGWPGLILFFTMLFQLGKNLWQSPDWRAKALLCGLIGISITALKLHSWESASVALLFWGACGIILAPKEKWRFWEKVQYWFQKLWPKN